MPCGHMKIKDRNCFVDFLYEKRPSRVLCLRELILPTPTTIFLLFLTLLLSACAPENSDTPDIDLESRAASGVGEFKTPGTDELMRVFVDGAGRLPDGRAVLTLSDPDNAGSRQRFVVEPVLSGPLPDGAVALIVNASAIDDSGSISDSHSDPGYLNVLIFSPAAGEWRIVARHENIVATGGFGSLGEVSWVDLGSGKSAIAISHGGTWQGYSQGYLTLFEVTKEAVRPLVEGVPIFASNEGACLDPLECWSVTAAVRYRMPPISGEYPDIELSFTGRRPAEDDTLSQSLRPVNGAAIYRFDGDRYRLAEGDNPVPEI